MATLKSSPANAKRYSRPRIEVDQAEVSTSRSNDPVTGEPKAYHIYLSRRDYDTEADARQGRTFHLELTPAEWAYLVKVWEGR